MVALGLLVTCPSAIAKTATPPPSEVTERVVTNHIDDLTQFLRRGGPANGTVNCGPVCTDLWLQEHRPIAGQPSSTSLHAELATLRRKTGVLPGLKSLPRALPRVAGAAGLMYAAWEIGNFIGGKVYAEFQSGTWQLGDPFEQNRWYEDQGAKPVYAGEHIVQINGQDYYAPDDGYLITYAGGPFGQTGLNILNGSIQLPKECANNTASIPPPSLSTTIITDTGGGQGVCNGHTVDQSYSLWSGFAYVPAKITTDTTPIVGASSTSMVPPAEADVRTAAANELQTNPQQYGNVIRWLDARTGGDSSNPLVTRVNVPDCVGLEYAECAGLLEDLDLVPSPTTLTPAQADLQKPAGAVVQTVPAPGTELDSGTTVTVKRNPSTLPVLVPEPGAQETYQEYLARLQALGLVGNVITLSDTSLDPTKGPGVVVSVVPSPGSRVVPGNTVAVKVNPETAPDPVEGVDWQAPPVPDIDLSPLGEHTPTDRFPFAVPSWVLGAIGGWSGSGSCPSFDFGFPGWEQYSGHETKVTLDMCTLQPGVDVIRPVFAFAGLLLCMWFFMGAAMGFGGGGNEP